MSSDAASFTTAVRRRLSLRALMVAAAIILTLSIVGSFGLVTVLWVASANTVASRLLENAATGLAIFIAVQAADEAVDRGATRLAAYPLAVLTGACIGALIGYAVRELIGLRYGYPSQGYPTSAAFPVSHRIGLALFGVLIGGLATAVHVMQHHALSARRRQNAAEHRRREAQRRTLASELQALQARVEPAFLFDTLHRIRDLYERDRDAANTMLEDLITYLRAALPHMREATSTLAQELTLVRAWTEIVRRGAVSATTALEVDAPDEALQASLPALVLLPLVQLVADDRNGAWPRLRLSARCDQGQLHLELLSSDPIFSSPQAGATLGPVHKRLQLLYPEGAELVVRDTAQGGSAVQVTLPFNSAPGELA